MKLLNPENIIFLDQTDSTNSYLLRDPELLKNDGLILVAHRQTSGRGQKNRNWESGTESNLFFSFLTHIKENKDFNLTLLAPLLAVPVLKTLNNSGIEDLKIKWPNDLLYKKKKLAGILCESTVIDDLRIIVAGIGVNLYGKPSHFSENILHKVDTVENITGIKYDKKRFINMLILEINLMLESIINNDISLYLSEWIKNCYCIDKKISIKKGEEIITGLIQGISEKGELIINYDNKILFVDSGVWLNHCE